MKFEQPPGSVPENESEELKDTRLNEGEAHDEANMLRAKMDVNPYLGTVKKEASNYYGYKWKAEVEPTAEDYDKALEAIQELKEAAEKEPGVMKVLYQLGRIVNKSKLATAVVMDSIGGAVGAAIGGGSRLQQSIDEFSNTRLFEDAVARLKKMKKEGKQWGKDEKEHYRQSHPNDQEYKKAA
ncbi:MAG: hypothetical protein Q7R86_02980 [bacterium]|nr:hypothetical protein [bacterium]